jgi:two-component system, sensor histidine kinase
MPANPFYRWLARQPIARKVTAIVMIIGSVVLALACAVFAAYDLWSSRARLVRDTTIIADVVGSNSTAALMFHDDVAARETLQAVSATRNIIEARLYGLNGSAVATYKRGSGRTVLPDAIDLREVSTPVVQAALFADGLLRVLRPVRMGSQTIGAIVVVTNLDEIMARLVGFSGIVLSVIFGTYWIGLFLSRQLSRVTFAPIASLIEVTRTVRQEGRYDVRAQRSSDDEIGELIDRFNDMLVEVQRRDQQLVVNQEDLERMVDSRTTALRTANEDLVVARDRAMEASRAKSDFLANMSHEIRTPMNGIIGMTDLVLDSSLTADQRDCLATVRTSADTLLTILNDILDFSKIESRKLQLEAIPFSVRDVVTDLLRPFQLRAAQKGIALIADIYPTVPDGVLGDPVRFQQILANLVGNALKFTEEGHVLVDIREDVRTGNRSHLHVSVTDTGIGISRDKLETIFEAFSQADGSTTRRYGGTGLGLTISASLVRLMGGSLRVESEPGAGTTFHFSVTYEVADVPAPAARAATTPRAVQRRALHVLLVEDNVVNQRVAMGLLGRRGHRVALAANGQEALDAIGRSDFDAVLMDLQMPVMGGLEVTRAIRDMERGTTRHLRIIAMTAHAMTGDRDRCLAAGMDAYLSKPIDPRQLFATLEDALPKAAAPRAAVPADGPAAPRPVFDVCELRDRVSDDLALMADVIQVFIEDCPARLDAIRSAIDAGNAAAVQAAARALEGSAANMAAIRLADAARTLEHTAAAGRTDTVADAWRIVVSAAAQTLDAMNRVKSTMPEVSPA